MSLPPVEPLFEHLLALKAAENPADPRHAARWREVSAWLEAAFPGARPETEDARQETLISLLRHVGRMRAEAPLQAAKWVSTIHRRKRVDVLRATRFDPVDQGLKMEPRRPQTRSVLERIEADDSPTLSAAMLEGLITLVLSHVHGALEASVKSAAKRQLRRTQAQAALLRLVCAWEAEAIIDALDYGEPISKDRLYKWVERGRAPVRLGLERWIASVPPDEREQTEHVARVLEELMEDRRADAGIPRPERRKST